MKKYLVLILILGIACVAQAQFPYSQTKIKVCVGNQSTVQGGNLAVYNKTYHDTLKTNDTLVVIIPCFYPNKTTGNVSSLDVPYSNNLYPEIIEYWKKAGTTDTIVTVTFWQSLSGSVASTATTKTAYLADGTTTSVVLPAPLLATSIWKQIKNTTTPTNYTVNETVTSAATAEYDFYSGVFYFTGRYLAIRYIARAKSGFAYCPTFAIRMLAH
jgi:hypothetical protein